MITAGFHGVDRAAALQASHGVITLFTPQPRVVLAQRHVAGRVQMFGARFLPTYILRSLSIHGNNIYGDEPLVRSIRGGSSTAMYVMLNGVGDVIQHRCILPSRIGLARKFFASPQNM